MNNKIRKLEKQWLKKNKVNISELLHEYILIIKFKDNEKMYKGYLTTDKDYKNNYLFLPLSLNESKISFKKSYLEYIKYPTNGLELHYKNIDWNN